MPNVKESTIPATAPGAVDDKLQSQCALPEYSRHSPEVCVHLSQNFNFQLFSPSSTAFLGTSCGIHAF